MARRTRYFLRLSYDGSFYHGWQIQPNNRSVQQTLNGALSKILNEPVNAMGCGRTDTGVHAREFYAHFETAKAIPERFLFKTNCVLPDDICIETIEDRGLLHARFDATERRYEYYIHLCKDAFSHRHSFYYPFHELDLGKMQQVAEAIKEYESFKPLCRFSEDYPHTLCTITESKWEQLDANRIRYTVSANRFLRAMVRRIVGSSILVGRGKMTVEEFRRVMDAQSEFKFALSAPPQGLFLVGVKY